MLRKKQLKEKYGQEKVFVVKHSDTTKYNNGFTSEKHSDKIWGKFDSKGHYAYRYDVEGEPVFQQIIPYIVISNESKNRFFVAERINGDERLNGKLTLGFGGHINEDDGNREVVFQGAVRELIEEVRASYTTPLRVIGYVRDMNSSTNDHLGIVITVSANENISVKETENLKGRWMNLKDLINNYESLENWSKHVVDHFVASNN